MFGKKRMKLNKNNSLFKGFQPKVFFGFVLVFSRALLRALGRCILLLCVEVSCRRLL